MADKLTNTDMLITGYQKINDLITEFNNTVIEGDSSVEAAQARVDADGVDHTTLKERLDTEHEDHATQLADIAVDVRRYGAVGDGSTDDTASIQSAIDSISQKGKLMFPQNKTFKITSTITIPADKEIVIEGNGSFIYSYVRDGINPALLLDGRTSGRTTIEDIPASTIISNLTIIGGSPSDHSHPTTAAKGSANGIEIYYGHRIQMINCKFLGFDKAGIYLYDTYYGSLQNVLCRYNKEYGFLGEQDINDCELNIKCEHNAVGARLTTSMGTTFLKPLLQGNYQNGLEVDSSQGIVAIDPYWEQNNNSDTAGLGNLSVTGGSNGDRFTLIGGRFAGDFETFFDGSARSNGGHHIICGVSNLIIISPKFTNLGTSETGYGGIKFDGTTGASITAYGTTGQFTKPYDYIEGSGSFIQMDRELQGNTDLKMMIDLLFDPTNILSWYNTDKNGYSRQDSKDTVRVYDNILYLRGESSGNGGVAIGDALWNKNPFRLENLKIWKDSNGTVWKNLNTPTSETDGQKLVEDRVSPPISATDSGKQGQIAIDSSYLYVCVATDTWKRIPYDSSW